MQLINSTVIRELSTIIFLQELISGGLYLGGGGGGGGAYIRGLITEGLISAAYNRVLISGGHIAGGLISGVSY